MELLKVLLSRVVYESDSSGVTIDHDESSADAGQDVSVWEIIFLKTRVLWQVLGGVYLLQLQDCQGAFRA
jgi:hypothetical protein